MELPEELLKRALLESKQNITETVRQGLEILAARRASRALAHLHGKVDLKINIKKLRKDRKS